MKKKEIKQLKGQQVFNTYETEIEYVCPVRGKVKQKVTVKQLTPAVDPTSTVNELLSNSITEKLDKQFSGLNLPDDSIDIEDIS